MTDSLQIAQNRIFAGGLDLADINRTLGVLMGASVDAADLYFQHRRNESWVLEDGIVKEGSHDIEKGVGARAIASEIPLLLSFFYLFDCAERRLTAHF